MKLSGWLVALAALFQVLNTEAQTYTLTDGNSSVSLTPGSSIGMNNWSVDGQNQLNQQWFYYTLGNSSVAAPINTLALGTPVQPSASLLNTTYTGAGFSLQAVYSLVGGALGSGSSDLGEQIKIQNTSSSSLTFHFFQYADFNIGGSADSTVVQLGKNIRGLFGEALVSSGNIAISENVDAGISPGANHGEAAIFNSTLGNLTTVAGYTLNDNVLAGPGHATWAFEWDATIGVNGTLIISKDLNIQGVTITPAPEPATWAMVSLGLVGFGVRRFLGRRK
jgi:hypothetical protein